jgi:hypothetical protein
MSYDIDSIHPAERASLVLMTIGAVALVLSHCTPVDATAAALGGACVVCDAQRQAARGASAPPSSSSSAHAAPASSAP